MGAKFVQDGYSVDYLPDVDVPQGEVVVLNQLVGVAQREIKAGTLGALAVEGIFDFPKEVGVGGDGFGLGAKAYWDTNTKLARWDMGASHKTLGKVVKAALDADETVRVMLVQAFD
ncbi:MAG: DUF2190 family protein [Planctomycetes bacterium]|nr:DUF2190 family protein [Planctomycetota bacterium]